MKELLEVREFEPICRNPGYRSSLPEPAFRELEAFVRAFTSDDAHADALEFLRIGHRRGMGDVISVNNYVGLIQTQSGFQIQVLPKIDLGDDPDEGGGETKRVFLQMLRSMKDFPGKALSEADLRVDRMPLYEIFVNLYLQQVRALVRRGIRSAYVAREENLGVFRGKLAVGEQIRQNAAHGERFFVRYDEYLADRPENRLVKAALLKLRGVAASSENQREIRQLLPAFEGVAPSANPEADYSRVAIDRSTRDYDMLVRWSRVFLLNRSFATFSGGHRAWALLFPMERVFEAYVARQLSKALADLGWEVSAQDRGCSLFDSPRCFALRPDIVIRRKDGSRVVLDTKWKRLENRPGANYGISQADMYQMYAYAKKYGAPEVWLLYPVNPEMRSQGDIAFESADDVRVRLFFVDLAHMESSMEALRERLLPG